MNLSHFITSSIMKEKLAQKKRWRQMENIAKTGHSFLFKFLKEDGEWDQMFRSHPNCLGQFTDVSFVLLSSLLPSFPKVIKARARWRDTGMLDYFLNSLANDYPYTNWMIINNLDIIRYQKTTAFLVSKRLIKLRPSCMWNPFGCQPLWE